MCLLILDDVCIFKGFDRSFFGWVDFGFFLVFVICFKSFWFFWLMVFIFVLLNDIFLWLRGGGLWDLFRCIVFLGFDLEVVDIEECFEVVLLKFFFFLIIF